ncbi:MAG: hypothetical protein ABSC23_02060 [Bryobacteraceae bacterium]
MCIRRCALFAWLAALPLCAGTISLSGQSTVTLHAGDALVFTISDYSFQKNAAAFGVSVDPSRVSFTLVTAPLDAWAFSAELTSLDGSISALFDNLALTAGSYQGTLYRGPVSSASGSLPLAAGLSSEIFAGPATLLTLRDTAGNATLGLAPYLLTQDLEVTFSSGGFSVGGTVAAVSLEQASLGPPMASLANLAADPGPDTPEPRPLLLTALGGVLLFAGLRVRTRTNGGERQ